MKGMHNPAKTKRAIESLDLYASASRYKAKMIIRAAKDIKSDPHEKYRLQRSECITCFYGDRINGRLAGSAFTSYECGIEGCTNEESYPNTDTPRYCSKHGICVRCGSDLWGKAEVKPVKPRLRGSSK